LFGRVHSSTMESSKLLSTLTVVMPVFS
jgi:hypothetical protein